MSHNQFEANPALQGDVKCFWAIEESQALYNSSSLIPDSYVELIFNCGAPLRYEDKTGKTVDLPRVFQMGLQTKPLNLRSTGSAHILAMRLYAWSPLRVLLDAKSVLPDAPIMPLPDNWQQVGKMLEDQMRHYGYVEAVDCLQDFVSHIRSRPHPDIAPIQAAGELLNAVRGQMRMRELAAQCYLSPSQFERRFKDLTGVSPKMMARLIRFHAIRNTLMNNPFYPLADLANDFGFTDQAHLIHDFKAFAGATPGEFAADAQTNGGNWEDADFLQYP